MLVKKEGKKMLSYCKTVVTVMFLMCGLFLVSCETDPDLPYEDFKDMQYGAYARQMSQTGIFNFFDLENSSIDIHVEYYDEAQGKNIAEYDIDIEYVDVVTGGAKSIARTDFMTIDASEFVVNSDGYLSSDISLGFTDALTALGITSADIDGGSYFRFWFTITKTDGTVFDYNNTGPNLMSSSAFGALFRLNVSIVCPSNLEGTFDAVTVGWCGLSSSSRQFQWVKSGAENLYAVVGGDFSYGAYLACYGGWTGVPAGDLKVQDACGILSPTGASQWSETYIFNDVSTSADNSTLTIDWVNDYGESGVSTLSNWSGGLWPDLN
ncbi:hypothetical protein DID76_01475 [Candidatus Marinamargulisbacteria bacterium SCGC AG-414-C22]|nr:hypothetical protein DID76_01475 [Candidatus Marinamargulisbacteria bacterium SCGC AG-414-C22]